MGAEGERDTEAVAAPDQSTQTLFQTLDQAMALVDMDPVVMEAVDIAVHHPAAIDPLAQLDMGAGTIARHTVCRDTQQQVDTEITYPEDTVLCREETSAGAGKHSPRLSTQ